MLGNAGFMRSANLQRGNPIVSSVRETFANFLSEQPTAALRDLAFGPIKGYFQLMSESFRRVVAVFLAVTFVVAMVPHGLRAADAGVQMVMVTVGGDMPMSGKCDGCGDHQKGMISAACSSLFCVNFVALPSIATVLELPPSLEAFEGFAGPLLTGHAISPDPYPPKPAVLS